MYWIPKAHFEMGLTEACDRRCVSTEVRQMPLCSRPTDELKHNFCDCNGESIDISSTTFLSSGKRLVKQCIDEIMSGIHSISPLDAKRMIEWLRKYKIMLVLYKDFSRYAYETYTPHLVIDNREKMPVLIGYYAIITGGDGLPSIVQLSMDTFARNRMFLLRSVNNSQNMTSDGSQQSAAIKSDTHGNQIITADGNEFVAVAPAELAKVHATEHSSEICIDIACSGVLGESLEPEGATYKVPFGNMLLMDADKFVRVIGGPYFYHRKCFFLRKQCAYCFFVLYAKYALIKQNYPISRYIVLAGCVSAVLHHMHQVYDLFTHGE